MTDENEYLEVLKEHWSQLGQWIVTTGDLGDESSEVYQMEVDDQMRAMRGASLENYRKISSFIKAGCESGNRASS